MSILEKAKQHAVALASDDPERVAALERRRMKVNAKAAELYGELSSVAGVPVRWNGKEGRMHVSLLNNHVKLNVTEREQYAASDGSIRKRDTRTQIASADASCTQDGYLFTEFAGATRSFAQLGDLVDCVAEIVGRMLVLEEMD